MFCAASAFCAAGCGGSSSSSSATDNPAALTAKAQTSPAGVLLTWTAPSLPTGANIIEYNLSRDGSVIATPTGSQTTYTDLASASATTVTYSTVASSPSLQATTVTAAVQPVSTGVSHTYSLSVVYLYSSGALPEYYEAAVGSSGSITLPSS